MGFSGVDAPAVDALDGLEPVPVSDPPVARVVLTPRTLDRAFDYLVPEGLASRVRLGSLVRVPLRGRRVRGWVVGFLAPEQSEVALEELRPIAAVLGDLPVLDGATLPLAAWAAREYGASLAAVLDRATPPSLPRLDAPMNPGGPLPRAVVSERVLVRHAPGDDARATVAERVAALGPGTQALVVTPFADGTAAALRGRVGGEVADMTGSQSAAARTSAWVAAAAGRARVLVAGRRGPLVPMPGLALIAVLAEESESHKDERMPALDARVLSRRRASGAGVPLVVFGATSPVGIEGLWPAAEAAGQRIRRLTLQGARDRWPRVEVLDRRGEAPGSGLVSERLFRLLHETRRNRGRSLLLLDRRGTARSLICRACGHLATCERCGAALRAEEEAMDCPRCGLRLPFVGCPSCGSDRLTARGIGVGRLVRDLSAALGNAGILRIEGEGVAARTGPVPPGGVAVGTRAVLGLEGRFDLVGLVDPDSMLSRPGLRAEEAAFAVLVGAAGKALPRARGGRVLVQTRQPERAAVRALAHADPDLFVAAELERRRKGALPPFGRMVVAETPDPGLAAELAWTARSAGGEALGPTEEGARSRLLVLSSRETWPGLIRALRGVARENPDVRLRLEVDPLDPM